MNPTPFLRASPARSRTELPLMAATDEEPGEEAMNERHLRMQHKSKWTSTTQLLGFAVFVMLVYGYIFNIQVFHGQFHFSFQSISSNHNHSHNAPPPPPPKKVFSDIGPPSLHLLGERHSGTKWMVEHLEDCFGQDVVIRKGYSAWKHWFQKDMERDNDVDNGRPESVGRSDAGAVILSQHRNPYYWVEAMRQFPHHSPEHFDLDWKTFVAKPWTMPRYGPDVVYDGIEIKNSKDHKPDPAILQTQCRTCTHMNPYDVIPCLANWTIVQTTEPNVPAADHQQPQQQQQPQRITDAFYELQWDGSGRPYDSILELRRDKILNFLHMSHFVGVKASYAVQYDELVETGTDFILAKLEEALGVKATCQPYPGQGVGTTKTRRLDPEFVEYVKENLDWDAEAMVGFRPRDY